MAWKEFNPSLIRERPYRIVCSGFWPFAVLDVYLRNELVARVAAGDHHQLAAILNGAYTMGVSDQYTTIAAYNQEQGE